MLFAGLIELARPDVLDVLDELDEALGIGDAHRARALHRDGLEVLGTHDRAEGAHTRDGGLVGQDGGEDGHVLASRADGGDARLAVRALPELVLHGEVVHTPQVRSVADLYDVVVDVDIDGLLGLALDENAVVAGELHLGGEVAAEARAGIGTRVGIARGADGGHKGAPAVEHGAGQGTGEEAQDVLRVERAHLGAALGPLNPGAQTAASHPFMQVIGVGGNLLDGGCGEVDLQQGADVPVHFCHDFSLVEYAP